MATASPAPSRSSTSTPLTPPGVVADKPVATAIDIRAYRPLPLTAAQEGQVRDLYYKNVRSYCSNEIRDFAQCAAGRTFTIPVVCRTQRLAMNDCMNAHATREEEDRAREQWFQQIPQRKKEKEEKDRWQAEEKKKHREWWGLDEQGNRIFEDGKKEQGKR